MQQTVAKAVQMCREKSEEELLTGAIGCWFEIEDPGRGFSETQLTSLPFLIKKPTGQS